MVTWKFKSSAGNESWRNRAEKFRVGKTKWKKKYYKNRKAEKEKAEKSCEGVTQLNALTFFLFLLAASLHFNLIKGSAEKIIDYVVNKYWLATQYGLLNAI